MVKGATDYPHLNSLSRLDRTQRDAPARTRNVSNCIVNVSHQESTAAALYVRVKVAATTRRTKESDSRLLRPSSTATLTHLDPRY